MEINKLLIFDISGHFAHFKKYYTNASSLSYGIPPRTVIAGLIAGIIGKEKDTYYDLLGIDQAAIGVTIIAPYRKIMQTMNYYNIEFKNYSLRYQVPMEVLIPLNNDLITYRIFFFHNTILKAVKEKVQFHNYVYNPYLGISEFLADIHYIDYIENAQIKAFSIYNQTDIRCCIRKKYIKNLNISQNCYVIERMPVAFKPGRELFQFEDFFYDESGNFCKLDFYDNASIFNIQYRENYKIINENIVFME